MEHEFTTTIRRILSNHFGRHEDDIFQRSDLIQYLNNKTRSASRGSKARGAFGNIYAIYVLVEDYVNHDFDANDSYADYDGAQFSELLQRMRQLPFGRKLQNHPLNHRLNQEFRRMFPQQNLLPVIRETETRRYWINENLLLMTLDGEEYNLSRSVLDIVDAYVETKQGAFKSFIADVENLRRISQYNGKQALTFIHELLQPNVDARVFEIVSYAILKAHFHGQSIYWGWTLESLHMESLTLYKTGRTNANDGGIDFVMKPLGRFFQVTETIDVGKYFLDIDKVNHYPITFVIKSQAAVPDLTAEIQSQARQRYPVNTIVNKYMSSIEEIINIPHLLQTLGDLFESGRIADVIDEILVHSKVEFQYTT